MMRTSSYQWLLWVSFFAAAIFLAWRLWPDARHHDWTGVGLTLLFWGGGVVVALYRALRGRGRA
jgi:hypothetical protein